MNDDAKAFLPAMQDAHDRFMEAVNDLRPDPHRYCARVTGSVFDGEDVVQETLAKAYYALGQMLAPPNMRPWLFRIAHNAALDFLKRADRKNVDLVAEVPEPATLDERLPDPDLVEAALGVFAILPPVQRSAVILKDVLGHSLEETAATMDTSVGAVKAALSRGRANIARSKAGTTRPPLPPAPNAQATIHRYAALFNARDWSGMRSLLGAEAQLDIVSRLQHRASDAGYYERYAEILRTEELYAASGFVDVTPAIAISRAPNLTEPAYFILIDVEDGRVSRIRDYRYISYITADARFRIAD